MARKATASVESPVSASDREAMKAANFIRLMNARLSKMMDQFDSLENTTNPASYSWTKEHAAKIIEVIEGRTAALKARLGEGSEAIKTNGKGVRVMRAII